MGVQKVWNIFKIRNNEQKSLNKNTRPASLTSSALWINKRERQQKIPPLKWITSAISKYFRLIFATLNYGVYRYFYFVSSHKLKMYSWSYIFTLSRQDWIHLPGKGDRTNLSHHLFFIFLKTCITYFRSSCPEVFCKEGVLRNFTKLTGKHLRLSLFLYKAAGLRPVILLKRRLWHRCFPVNFAKF